MSQITAIAGRPYLPHSYSGPDPKVELIKQVVRRSLAEVAICFTIGFVVSFFVAPAAISLLFGGIALQCLCSFAIRTVEAMTIYNKEMTPARARFYRLLRTGAFSYVSGKVAQDLVHETGHYTMLATLCKGANPRIRIAPFARAVTTFSTPKGLSPLGRRLGALGTMVLMTAAGPGLTLLVSSILLWLSQRLCSTHPEISAYLFSYSFNDFFSHAWYALSTLWTNPTNFAHDFVRLTALTGISPLIMLTVIVAIPIIIYSSTAHYRQAPCAPTRAYGIALR